MGLVVALLMFAGMAAVATVLVVRSGRRAERLRSRTGGRTACGGKKDVVHPAEAAEKDEPPDPLPAAIRAVQRDPVRAARAVSKMMGSED